MFYLGICAALILAAIVCTVAAQYYVWDEEATGDMRGQHKTLVIAALAGLFTTGGIIAGMQLCGGKEIPAISDARLLFQPPPY